MNVNIEVLSPVHIGSGNEYGSSSFIIRSIKNNKKYPALIKENLDGIFESILETNKEKYYNSLLNLVSRNGKLEIFFDNIQKEDKKLYNKISNRRLYFSILKYPFEGINIPTNENINNERNVFIKEHVKTDNKAFIPGSSLKGAIRNCLLYNTLNIRGYVDFRNTIMDKDNKLKNLMKYLQVTDTNHVSLMSIYKTKSIGTNKPTDSFLETIDETKDSNYQINCELIDLHNPKINENINPNFFDIKNIFEAIYNFSSDLIEHELDFSEKINNYELEDFYHELKEKNSKKEPLLKIGMGAGFLSMGTALKLKNLNENEFDNFRREKRLGKKGSYDFPKTRRLIVGSDKPLGWIKLKKEE